jgi:hypothetical protein
MGLKLQSSDAPTRYAFSLWYKILAEAEKLRPMVSTSK